MTVMMMSGMVRGITKFQMKRQTDSNDLLGRHCIERRACMRRGDNMLGSLVTEFPFHPPGIQSNRQEMTMTLLRFSSSRSLSLIPDQEGVDSASHWENFLVTKNNFSLGKLSKIICKKHMEFSTCWLTPLLPTNIWKICNFFLSLQNDFQAIL